MKKNVLVIACLLFSVASLAQENASAPEADERARTAQWHCDRIQQDVIWQQEISNATSRETVLSNIRVGRPGAAYSTLMRFSYKALAAAVNDFTTQPNNPSGEMINFFIRLSALETLQRCGASLQQQGKIAFLLPQFDREGMFSRINQCVTYQDALVERVGRTQGRSQRAMELDILHSRDPYSCRNIFPQHVSGMLVYPLHLNIRGGAKKFEEYVKSKKYIDDVARIDDIVARGREHIANIEAAAERERIARALREEQAKKAREERIVRLDRVRNGNLRAAQTCGEIAEASIPPANLAPSMGAGFPISRNSQAVLRAPSRNLYATVGRLISYNSRQATTHDVNMFTNQGHAFVLKFSRQTIWFNDVVSVGTTLYFVGRYVDNANVPLRQGSNTFEIPARVYEVVCASSL